MVFNSLTSSWFSYWKSASSNIVRTFSEAVDRETGNILLKKTSDNSTIETIDVTSGQVTGSGTNQITINPNSSLVTGTEYYVQIAATAFDDAAGHSYSGINDTTSFSFTVDTNNPTLSSSSPADNATNYVVGSDHIVLNFSEAVDVETGNLLTDMKMRPGNCTLFSSETVAGVERTIVGP